MFKEYDVIIAKKAIDNVPKGSKGAVLIVYEGGLHYEIEFVDTDGNSINILTVSALDIEKWPGDTTN